MRLVEIDSVFSNLEVCTLSCTYKRVVVYGRESVGCEESRVVIASNSIFGKL